MLTGSLVLSSGPEVEPQLLGAFGGAIESSVAPQVLLVRVDDLDAPTGEDLEQLVKLVPGGEGRRQQLVDLVGQQVTAAETGPVRVTSRSF
jgi:hypothetical protein